MMSNQPQKNIVEFIGEHHVLSLATTVDNQPYLANCFYVYLSQENCFIFTSDPLTRHGQEMTANPRVAANIVLETKAVGKIQGLQIMGACRALSGAEEKEAKRTYLKKYPFAILKMETMWMLEVDFFKLTDNRLGFGKKMLWEKNQD